MQDWFCSKINLLFEGIFLIQSLEQRCKKYSNMRNMYYDLLYALRAHNTMGKNAKITILKFAVIYFVT